jgi:hypothetical protein
MGNVQHNTRIEILSLVKDGLKRVMQNLRQNRRSLAGDVTETRCDYQ